MTARILALDTTSEFGSLAALEGDRLIEETPMTSSDGFSHVLFDQLEQFLARLRWSIDSVDCFACTAGPGSFTGLRVGLAAVKGLAEATNKPVVAVSNLEVLASFGSKPLRAAIADARRGEIYGGLFDAQLQPLLPERVMKLAAFRDALPKGDLEFIAAGFEPFRDDLAGACLTTAPRFIASAVARLAAKRLAAGECTSPISIDANYVRRNDANMLWQDR